MFFGLSCCPYANFFVPLQLECNRFAGTMEYSLNCRGRLLSLSSPKVMAIINLTPDSFSIHCPATDERTVLSYVSKTLEEGADIVDLGACSTRPGSKAPLMEEEWERLEPGLRAVRRAFPDAILSVDTYRGEIMRRSMDFGVDIINDVSGAYLDSNMYDAFARARVPYILTHTRGTPATMSQMTEYEHLVPEVIDFLQHRLDLLHSAGMADVIVDPGFGFAKTVEQNYELLRHLRDLEVLESPILVGVSRKSMIQRVLEVDAEHALNGTTALHMVALRNGANLLRVHDVRAAKEAIKIHELCLI